LYKDGKVTGAKIKDTGLNRQGHRLENYQAGTRIEAKITIFAEGTRGSLTKMLIKKFNLNKDRNTQVYSLGCKELWSVPETRLEVADIKSAVRQRNYEAVTPVPSAVKPAEEKEETPAASPVDKPPEEKDKTETNPPASGGNKEEDNAGMEQNKME
jgi:hypothetical protein